MRLIPAAMALLVLLCGCAQNPKAVQDGEVDQQLVNRYLQTQDRGGRVDDAGMSVLSSGLRYQVIEEGTGRTPGYNDTVLVNYRGWNAQGQLFDDSYRRGRPAMFQLGDVIEGWTQALSRMQEGATWRIIVPPYLAYGPKGNGQTIGPNETLTFEIELLQVR